VLITRLNEILTKIDQIQTEAKAAAKAGQEMWVHQLAAQADDLEFQAAQIRELMGEQGPINPLRELHANSANNPPATPHPRD
jgi:hypothetical protein